jgi:hypothetical protein
MGMKTYLTRILIALVVLALALSGCNLPQATPSPTASFTALPQPPPSETRRPPTKTPIPTPTQTLPPTETYTPEPTLSPTVTLTYTPTPLKVAVGAHFRGDFDEGHIEFDISVDGRYVEKLKIVIRSPVKCQDGKRLGSDYRLYLPYRILISEHGFPTAFGSLALRGWFSTYNSTMGDFTLTNIEVAGRKPCTIGPIQWTAWVGG